MLSNLGWYVNDTKYFLGNTNTFVVAGIANALDLTDRILPRLQARPRCKPQLLHFSPYSREQIVRILEDRLENVSLTYGYFHGMCPFKAMPHDNDYAAIS